MLTSQLKFVTGLLLIIHDKVKPVEKQGRKAMGHS
jgi:hypothetical protein